MRLALTVFGSIAMAMVFSLYVWFPYAPRSVSELSGTYVLDCDLAREELILNVDGTFAQTAIIKATRQFATSKGTWKYSTRVSKRLTFGQIRFSVGFMNVFNGFGELNPDFANPKRPGATVMGAHYWFGHIVLGMADALPYWQKVD